MLQREFAEATESFKAAIRIQPSLPDAQENLAHSLAAEGKIAEALSHYREALRLDPQSRGAAVRLSWHLATDADAQLRDGVEAVRVAERVAASTKYRSPQALDALAAAYAEIGRYSEAVTAAATALHLARLASKTKLARQISERLALYEKRRPFRQAGVKQ